MSDFYVYDASRDRVGQLQNITSVQWLEHYQASGEVKLIAHATENNLALLVEGNRIHNPDSNTAAVICHIDLDQAGTVRLVIVRAFITLILLNERVVMGTVNISNVETGMYEIYGENRRGMPIELSAAKGFTEATDTQVSWGQVLDAEMKLAETSGLGFKVDFDPETALETFTVYKGVDRSDDASDDYVGYFGTDVDGIENATVTSGITDYKNVAVVAGAGEGANRTVRIVSLGLHEGEQRRELFVDARDLQREYQVAKPTGEYDSSGNPIYTYESKVYSEAEYNALLDTRGREKLAEHLRTFSITCDITQNNIIYGVDYHLGDRIPVKLPEYGIFASARLASATRIYEPEGIKIVAILSEFELEGLQ